MGSKYGEGPGFLPCFTLPLNMVIESGFRYSIYTSRQFYVSIPFLASTRAAVMDFSLYCFLLQLGAAFGVAVVAGLALALRPPVFNFLLGIIPITHVHIFN